MNNIEMIKNFMTNGLTPKGIAKQMMGNNPMFNNLIQMAENGDNKSIENFARNLFKEKGLDFDKELANFKQIFK